MAAAIDQANRAAAAGEIPIGAVIVRGDKIIANGYNVRERKQNAIWHAEMVAINAACRRLKTWRLDDCEMYVTLEPCQMCMGAIKNARIRTVYFGAKSTTDLNWHTNAVNLENQICSKLLKDFFTLHR